MQGLRHRPTSEAVGPKSRKFRFGVCRPENGTSLLLPASLQTCSATMGGYSRQFEAYRPTGVTCPGVSESRAAE